VDKVVTNAGKRDILAESVLKEAPTNVLIAKRRATSPEIVQNQGRPVVEVEEDVVVTEDEGVEVGVEEI